MSCIRSFTVAGFCCVLLLSSQAAALEPTSAQLTFFEEQVRPLLADKCYRCHGRDKQEAALRLDSRAAILAGGESGAAVEPGETETSLIVEAINYQSLEMPPDEQLDNDQIDILTRWVQMGAPWPAANPDEQDRPIITERDRSFWSFQPVRRPPLPVVEDGGWSRNPIDRFVFRRLAEVGLSPAAAADRVALIRRVYFDLIGLPPAVEEIDAYLADRSPLAYERLIERLLESPRYGEKWGRHWLDLVRYAESNGHGNDQFRPTAYRYRDYVVRALNADKPYDRFVTEQLAGDEVAPDDPDALVATGFLRHWIYESNQRKVRLVREIILNDVTEVTGEVFLGMGLSCARCHDHKFDPIPRRDYYRLQAFFAPMLARDDVPLIDRESIEAMQPQRARWEEKTAEIRQKIDALEYPVRRKAVNRALRMFPQEIKDIYRKPREENTPLELQLVALVDRQVRDSQYNPEKKLSDTARQEWEQLVRKLDEYDDRPADIPYGMVVEDIGPVSPPTLLPGDRSENDILPGFLSVLDAAPAEIDTLPSSTGRRAALAKWITSPDNPLSTRVIVNRIWQYHFGRGLVATSSDFGRLGASPSHPELLDWLADRFVTDGWSVKSLHRLIMNSATYRQASLTAPTEIATRVDPGNTLLWRAPIRRLTAEQIRDSVLWVSGRLDLTMAGPSVEGDEPRRTIYTKIIRNSPQPLLRVFDAPDGFGSTAQRDVTTTATQALTMINGEWPRAQAANWSGYLREPEMSTDQRIERAYRAGTGRRPDPDQLTALREFLGEQARRISDADSGCAPGEAAARAWEDLCHVILNSNAFLYID